MKGDKSLLQHPFNIQTIEESLVCSTESGFCLQFGNDLFSKSVSSTKEENEKRFIILEFEDDSPECRVVYETSEIHRFRAPADFYVPMDEASKVFYNELYDCITTADKTELSDYATKFTEHVQEHGFPPATMPLTTIARHFTRFVADVEEKGEADRILCQKRVFGEEVPTGPDQSVVEMVRKRVGPEGFAIQERFLNELFRERPVWRYSAVLVAYEKNLTEEERAVLKKWNLKACLAIHSYFCLNGPWKKQWIVFGCDPSKDATNYRYQLCAFERSRPIFQVRELETVTKEVDARPDRYLRKVCDPAHGFISDALKNFILLTLDSEQRDKSG